MEFDVVIVGAGLSCALTLQKNNLTFAIVESGDTPAGNSMVTALRSQNCGGDCWRVMLKDLQDAFHQLQKSCFQHVSGVLK